MRRVFFVLIIASLVWDHHKTKAECSISPEPRTRIFDNVAHYQGNKLPFNPIRGGWAGSNVEFNSSLTIEKLPKNVFMTHDSQSIISLRLSSKRIKEADEGAFLFLDCLHELYLDRNNITKLSRGVFEGLNKLNRLDLSRNKLEVLKDLTFANLARLRSLNLGSNRIKTLELLAFTNLSSLEYLNLEYNLLGKVYNDVFRPIVNLETLILSWNRLSDIEPEKWGGLTKLQKLELAGNHLDHFDPSYNFSFFSLKSLNLSSNSLTTLNVVPITRHLPRLEMIDLNNNPWFCDDLERTIHDLTDSRITLQPGNFSTVNTHGIACSEVPIVFSTTSSTVAPSTITLKTTTTTEKPGISKEDMERFVEKKIEDNNEDLRNSITSLRTFVIFVFALVCIFIIVEVLYRTNFCGFLINRLRAGPNTEYVDDDDDDIENFRLLHR